MLCKGDVSSLRSDILKLRQIQGRNRVTIEKVNLSELRDCDCPACRKDKERTSNPQFVGDVYALLDRACVWDGFDWVKTCDPETLRDIIGKSCGKGPLHKIYEWLVIHGYSKLQLDNGQMMATPYASDVLVPVPQAAFPEDGGWDFETTPPGLDPDRETRLKREISKAITLAVLESIIADDD
jgi:hypothetical protein